jgi:hypothetical protein
MDVSATSVGTAKMEVTFTATSSGYLAPGTGNYTVVRGTPANVYHFFWADNTSTGYGSIDNNISLTGSGPYTADLEIYIDYNSFLRKSGKTLRKF